MNIYKIANIYWTESTSDLEEKFEALQELEGIWTTFYTDANSSQSFLRCFWVRQYQKETNVKHPFKHIYD